MLCACFCYCSGCFVKAAVEPPCRNCDKDKKLYAYLIKGQNDHMYIFKVESNWTIVFQSTLTIKLTLLYKGRRFSSSYNSIVAVLNQENGGTKDTIFRICFFISACWSLTTQLHPEEEICLLITDDSTPPKINYGLFWWHCKKKSENLETFQHRDATFLKYSLDWILR